MELSLVCQYAFLAISIPVIKQRDKFREKSLFFATDHWPLASDHKLFLTSGSLFAIALVLADDLYGCRSLGEGGWFFLIFKSISLKSIPLYLFGYNELLPCKSFKRKNYYQLKK
jgi:hypothetical protein